MKPNRLISLAAVSFILLSLDCLPAPAQQSPSVNRHALILQDFQSRVAQYVKLRKQVAASLPPLKSTASATKLSQNQRLLARKIQAARSGAKRGDIFTPEISAEFKRLIRLAMSGNARRVRSSMKQSEHPPLRIYVNEPYPESASLPSTPPTLLANLPNLPPEMDYHLIGRNLVLRDVNANLVVDFIPAAVP